MEKKLVVNQYSSIAEKQLIRGEKNTVERERVKIEYVFHSIGLVFH